MFSLKKISLKLQLVSFLLIFLVFLSFSERDYLFLVKTILAVLICAIVDSLFTFLKNKKIKISESSLITGLIIGFVLSSYVKWWFILCSGALAIISKYLIRFKDKHIFNPAALGIFLAVAIFKQTTQWHGSYYWYIIIPFGLYFVWRIKKITIVSAYFLTYILISAAQWCWLRIPFIDQLYYANYFFVFIMLIEPKTSPFDLKGKIVFGMITSLISSLLYLVRFPYDADLPALLLSNIAFWLAQQKGRSNET